MFIITFVSTYVCFPFFSVYCNFMLATIKKKEKWRFNYILSLNKTKVGVGQISPMETY